MSKQEQMLRDTAARAKIQPALPAQAGKHRRLWKIASSIAAFYLLLNIGGKCRIATREYQISDPRVLSEVRICVVSDLHGARYGNAQERLLAAIESANPDAVLLLGDLFDQHGKNGNTTVLLNALSNRYPCYFVFGNHEYKTGSVEQVRALVKKSGIPILAGDSALMTAGESRIRIFGIDDGRGGKQKQLLQIAKAAQERSEAEYSILAIHVPNGVESYLNYGFDLMLSGHTHGGQMQIPGLLNGLYAPGQGLFPKYGGGRYELENTTLIICRGLARKPYWLPRLFNPPELVVVSLSPSESGKNGAHSTACPAGRNPDYS